MSDWFSKAQKFVDNFTESIVEQANVAQAQMADEQTKIREEVAKDKMTRDGEASLPWETDDDSLAILTQDVMEKVLSLSLTEQNFTVSPPKVEVFSFLFSNHIPTAMRLLSLDANLARMHAKVCNEFFFHCSLQIICKLYLCDLTDDHSSFRSFIFFLLNRPSAFSQNG